MLRGARWAVLALLLAGVVAAAPARAQVVPPTSAPLGHLVWTSSDGRTLFAHGELLSIIGLNATWDTARPAREEGTNVRYVDTLIGQEVIFTVRFSDFQAGNISRVLVDSALGNWYVVLTNTAVSGGVGTYMYWKLLAVPTSAELVGDVRTYQVKVLVTYQTIQGVNECVVTRSGASGPCVLPPAQFAVVLPRPVVNKPTWVQVTARDVLGQRVRSYLGTVRFTATRPSGAAVRADLPADSPFLARHAGNRVFNGVVFRETGGVQLTVQDIANASLRGRVGVNVLAPPTGCSSTGC